MLRQPKRQGAPKPVTLAITHLLVPKEGLEPTPHRWERILSSPQPSIGYSTLYAA